ncbi:hypothetical protein IQ266_23030 [filamentous cyanobacterium LEGE 11480]|uniref:Uncharacterized protein n=1 Tax=Romeriopsis navalis LEGE 11480 TaxID=2777977 RepID=A0A928VQ46_9CYAN|nr:DUF6010 family protein [Romeriopsis navalis]MBE9032616.1 hypothetical protein [Romeriopsis navalis LEGE 11480]
MLIFWLLLGVLAAIVFVAIARRQASQENLILALGLLVAALVYVGFAWLGRVDSQWQLIELLGVGLYGLCALLGVMYSPWWLMVGWLVHPLWDVGLHLLKAGATFTPEWYVLMCIGFDVLVAANIAVRQLGGVCLTDASRAAK